MKKILLFIIIISLLSFLFFPIITKAEEADKAEKEEKYEVDRHLGNDKISGCNPTEGQTWECDCQGSNNITCKVGNIISDPICACCGDCNLDNFISIGTNLANLIFKYLGVVALVLFVVGGVVWITSGGSQERIKMGKTILKNALIGLAIIIAANLIIRFVTEVLGVEDEYLESDVTTTQEE